MADRFSRRPQVKRFTVKKLKHNRIVRKAVVMKRSITSLRDRQVKKPIPYRKRV